MKADVTVTVRRLHLRHTWKTAMASSDFRDTVHVRYVREGLTGYGEGAPIQRYGESAETARLALEAVRNLLEEGDPFQYVNLLDSLRERLGPRQPAALSAVDSALLDWVGQQVGLPLWRMWGLNPQRAPLTSVSIGIGSEQQTREKVRELAAFPILKVKVGTGQDEETIRAIRSVTTKPLRVDANEGWMDPDEAVRQIRWLETEGVELIEQPMPASMRDEMRWVRSRVRMPLVADESCTSLEAIPGLAGLYDGINVKLDKSGGMLEALRWIAAARASGLQVMLGCMVSSACACTAAAHLGALADWADLDGSVLLQNDPFHGMELQGGRMVLPRGNGLGVTPRSVAG